MLAWPSGRFAVARARRAWLLSTGLSCCLLASPAGSQTLFEAMASAYASHPALDAQRANLRALDAEVDGARGGWRPSLSLTGGTGRRIDAYTIDNGPSTSADRAMSDVRIRASQPVLNWTAQPTIQAAQARARQGRADLLGTEQAVLMDVATAYLDVLQYRQLLALNEDNERSLARQVEYRSEYFSQQLGTRTELAQARARHAVAVAQLDRIRGELEAASRAYLRHVGQMPGELFFPEHLPPLPDSLERILSDASEQFPAVRSAYDGAQAARADVEIAKGKLKPSVTLEAAGAWARNPTDQFHSQRDASVQLTLSIPLYEAGVQRAQVRSSAQRAIQLQSQWRDSRLQARYDAADAWRLLHAAQAEIEAFNVAIEANKLAYQGVREAHAGLGELTLIEVLNAKQELFQSETSLVRARTEAALSHLRLLAAQGRLTAQGLALPVLRDATR